MDEKKARLARIPTDPLVKFGGNVKAISGGSGGKVAGYLVTYGSPGSPDLTGDYFTKDTDFGSHETSLVFYHHGMDEKLKRTVLDDHAKLKKDSVGVWIEAQLALRDEYMQAIYDLVKAGALSWSSGSASHLCEREPMGKAYRITRWPLGLDASLTPTPAEPRNNAVTLKSLYPVKPSAIIRIVPDKITLKVTK